MITCLHIDFRLRLDAVVYNERERITEGRNRPRYEIREQRIDLASFAISTSSPSWFLYSEIRR